MKKTITTFIIVLAELLLLAGFALAQTTTPTQMAATCGTAGQPPCGICDLFKLVNNIIGIVIKVIVPLLGTLVIVIAGAKMAMNMDNSEILAQTKKIILLTIGGLVLVYASYALVGAMLVGMGYTTNAFDWAPKCK